MGDWFKSQQAPTAGAAAPDPSAGPMPTTQAYQQPSGLMGALSNPLIQGALSAYLGAVGSPKGEGLGHALMQGGLTGLGAFNQAQQQQMELPLKQAQLQQAQLQSRALGMQLRPLTKDEVSGLDDWVNSLPKDPKDPNYDP
jgi:hypothetical protein